MSIEQFAHLYVNYLEPGFRFLGLTVVIIFLLYLLNIVRDSKKKTDLVNNAFSFIIKVLTTTLTWTGQVLLWTVRIFAKIITVIFASIRDFFTSKI